MVDNGSLTATGRHALAAWTGAVYRFAAAVVALLFVLTVLAAGYTATNLAINTSTTDMISAETPFRRNAIEFDKAFPQFKDLIVIVIDARTAEDAEIAAERMAAALREKPALFARVDRPGSEPYFARNGLLFQEPEELSALADQLAKAEPLLASLVQQPNLTGLFGILTQALQENHADKALGDLIDRIGAAAFVTRPDGLSWRDLIDPGGGRRQIVVAKAAIDNSSLSPGAKALSEIRRVAEEMAPNPSGPIVADTNIRKPILPDVLIRVTGSVALDYEELQSAALGGMTAGSISLVLVTVLLIAGLRSLSLILPAMITLIAGLIWTAAFAAIAVGHLNLISVAFAVLFVGLGIDFSIHYCLRYREVLGQTDHSVNPLESAASGVGGSLTFSAICAALGFLAFLPTDYKGLAELGVISAGGMLIALFLNLTLLPALLTIFPTPSVVRAKPKLNWGTEPIHKPVIVLAILFGMIGGGIALQARFDFNPINLKDPRSESVEMFHDLAQDHRNGIYAIELSAPNRVAARAEAARLLALPEVGGAITIDSLVPENQEEKLAIIEEMTFFLAPALDPPNAQPTQSPEQRRAAFAAFQKFLANNATGDGRIPRAERAIRLLEMASKKTDTDPAAELERRLTKHLPRMFQDLRVALSAERVTIDDLPKHVREAWIAADGRARIQLLPATPMRGNDDIRRFARAVLATAPTAVGTPVTITEAGNEVVEAFQQATVFAFIAVCVVLLVVLRRVRDTLLVIFPLVLAAIYTGAASVLLDLPFNFANVIVLPLLFGLGVASGIHLVIRARRATDTASLMRTSTPRAVLFSALTTIASFGSLALSGHRGMTSMGQLLTIAIAFTLVCALIVLPALMIWVERRAAR